MMPAASTNESEVEKKPPLNIGEFVLDRQRYGLYRNGDRVHLTSKPLETLIFLVENRGRTIDKQTLLDVVWKDTFVTDDNLVQAVREIRRALGDDKENPRFVQTVPRHGYRFICDVTVGSPDAEQVEPQTHSRSDGGTQSLPNAAFKSATHEPEVGNARLRRTRGAPAIAVLLLVIASPLLLPIAVRWVNEVVSASRTVPRPAHPVLVDPTQVTWETAIKPSYSPDGLHLLYVGYPRGLGVTADLRVMQAVGGIPTEITENANVSGDMPVFTADGRFVVYSRYRSGEEGSTLPDLMVVPVYGGTPKLFIPEASGAGFSPDGELVAYTKYLPGRSPLWVSPKNNLEEHLEVSDRGFTPRWSPDSKWIAFSTSDPNGGLGNIWIASASSAGLRQVTHEEEQIYGLTWLPNGEGIIFASRRKGLFELRWVSQTGGNVVCLTPGVGDYFSPSVSPDGSTILFTHSRPVADIAMTEGVSNSATSNITEGEEHLWAALSPSGRRLASVIRRPDPDERLYVTDLSAPRAKKRRLSDGPARHPCWVNDDTVAYLETTRSGDTDVLLVNATDPVRLPPMTSFKGEVSWLAINKDRNRVAVVLKTEDGSSSIVLRDVEQPADTVIAHGGEYQHLRWSPDGAALSWSGPRSADQSSNGIWIARQASMPLRLFKDGFAPVWDADGKAIYFCRIGENEGLWRIDIGGNSSPRRLRAWRRVSSYDVVKNRLVFTQEGGASQIYSMSLAH
jgi:Tol biopolymer transport system component/DNA-binding winged helix-turn-helix (wHTH) protein